MTQSDESLREQFQGLKAEVQGRVPDAHAMLEKARLEANRLASPLSVVDGGQAEDGRSTGTRGPSAPAPWRQGWTVAAGALLAAGFAGLMFLGQGRVDEFDSVVTHYAEARVSGLWSTPTERLMNLPGSELMESMPSIGGTFGVQLPSQGRPRVENDT